MKTPHFDVKKSLGFWPAIENYAGISGMRAPIPAWFRSFPKPIQRAWRIAFSFFELSLIFMAVSTAVGTFTEPGTGKIESFGSLILLIGSVSKFTLIYNQRDQFEESLTDIHRVALQLHFNPVSDNSYLDLHHKETWKIHLYYKVRFVSVVFFCAADGLSALILNLISPKPDRKFPMYGWFPVDRTNPWQYSLVCCAQLEFYLLVLCRDIFCDSAMHLTLAAINTQLIYLGQLLEKIIQNGNDKRTVLWWICQHQTVLRNLKEFREIAASQMTILHFVPVIIFFLYLIRVTEEDDFVLAQHIAIIITTTFMISHVFIVSTIGDALALNSQRVCFAVGRGKFWEMPRESQLLIFPAIVRSSTPATVRFSKIASLRVENFGNIITKMVGYFNAIYQIRNG